MDLRVNQILADLYELDPELKQHETSLVPIIQKLLAAKPNPVLDTAFAHRLRLSLIGNQAETSTKRWSLINIINATTMKKLNYAAGLASIAALLVLGSLYYSSYSQTGSKVAFDNKIKITATGDHAFGKLDSVTQATGKGGGGTNTASSALPASTNTASEETLSLAPSPGMGGGGDAKLIAPYDYPTYRYVYKGDQLLLGEPKLEVLKRNTGSNIAPDVSNLFNSLSFGLANIGSFGGLRVQSVSFAQPNSDGYNIYVNVDEGSISINGSWPMPLMADSSQSFCAKENCGYTPVKMEEIPPDSEAIAIANQFLVDHGIPTTNYGLPEVRSEWRRYYEASPDKANYYFPETADVVYPLMIDERAVLEESGYKTGLHVSINVRNKKVVSVFDLSVQDYQSSMYDAETDLSRIMKLVERGGMYGYVDPNAQRVVEIELGNPTLEFVKMWNYSNNRSEELLIPSLVFPIVKLPESEPYFYRTSVTVPLVKEILDRNEMPVQIMPAVTSESPVR